LENLEITQGVIINKTEIYIDSIRVSLMNYQRTLILKEKEGKEFSLWSLAPM